MAGVLLSGWTMRKIEKLLLTALLTCCLVLLVAATSLWATPEVDLMCCAAGGDCANDEYCCPRIGKSCDDEGAPNYCMASCIWPG